MADRTADTDTDMDVDFDAFFDMDMTPPSAWNQRKPDLHLRDVAAITAPATILPPSQVPLPGFGVAPTAPATAQFQIPPNPYAQGAMPLEISPSHVNPSAPDLQGPSLTEQAKTMPPPKLNYAEKRAKELGIDKYTPQVPAGSQFPPALFKELCGKLDGMEDTPLQQTIKSDVEAGITQALDLKTMMKYADLQRERDKQEKDKKAAELSKEKRQWLKDIETQPGSEKGNGCMYKNCSASREEHPEGCTGFFKKWEGQPCTRADHDAGKCHEREENRRRKMEGVNLDSDVLEPVNVWRYPDVLEPPSGDFEWPQLFEGVMTKEEEAEWFFGRDGELRIEN